MSAAERLARTRAALGGILVMRALLWGGVVALAVALADVSVRSVTTSLPVSGGAHAGGLALLLVGVTIVALVAGLRRQLAPRSVALWIERHMPGLDYALVTLADQWPAGAFGELLERRVAGAGWGGAVARGAARALVPPLLLAAALGPAYAAVARRTVGTRGVAGVEADANSPIGTGRGRPSALASIRATVTPPAYARRSARELRDPTSVRELVGASVVIRGPTPGAALRAQLGGSPLPLARAGDGWRVAFAIPARAAAVTLTEGGRPRIVVLEPVPDSAPVVQLLAPARDSVFRDSAGRVALAATLSDDVGLARGGFEYIISSGSGESFTFRSGRIGDRALGNERSARLTGVVDLAGMGLKAGDVVHVRAVGTDGNTVSGPSSGTSETRTLRVARAGEYDSLSVEAAGPPAVDKSIVSQRMLLMLTEALERRRPRLARAELVRESRGIAVDQAKLRKAVSDIVFTRLGEEPSGEHAHFEGDGHAHAEGTVSGPLTPEELLKAADRATGTGLPGVLDSHGDETPVVAVNAPLLEAYNAMWDAGRELEAAEPRRALPPMRRALAAIQRARQAERVYLRGRPAAVVVDVARVRLQGTDKGAPNVRRPRDAADDPAGRLRARLTSALAVLERAPAAAVDSLTLLRVEALGDAPALAAALGDAVEQLRTGRDATGALVHARRVAGLVPSAPEPLGPWGQR